MHVPRDLAHARLRVLREKHLGASADKSLPVIREARRCTHCAADLPLGPRPLLAAAKSSRLLIIGQAPGAAAHESGIPWNDRSGERLRDWLGVTRAVFYDGSRVALMPMGFCYPGKGPSGDMPPRPECAPLWHDKIRRTLVNVRFTVFVGQYAFAHYLGESSRSITEAARAFAALLPTRIALPHPSPRNNIWLKKHRWFERDALPALRARVAEVLASK
ncbi:MAG: uracil-DNA glycosylase family protein [Phycisphaerales bacterium]|nr:uracil-DNA glycosylase family protein [Phycisphaerales bacterium]